MQKFELVEMRRKLFLVVCLVFRLRWFNEIQLFSRRDKIMFGSKVKLKFSFLFSLSISLSLSLSLCLFLKLFHGRKTGSYMDPVSSVAYVREKLPRLSRHFFPNFLKFLSVTLCPVEWFDQVREVEQNLTPDSFF